MKTPRRHQLEKHQQKGLWRQLNINNNSRALDFTKNDYLNRSQNPMLIEYFNKITKKYGIGSNAAQTIGGYTEEHAKLCSVLTDITNTESACIFTSGYLANLALISTIAQKDTKLILDKKCHASIITGAKLSKAKFYRYKNCDIASLRNRLENNSIVISDTVFSMSGEIAPIDEICLLSKSQMNTEIIIDDAHGFGVIGKNGLGAFDYFKLKPYDIAACTITFGKAIGTAGAAIVGSRDVIESIQQFASSYLFTTALAPNFAAASWKSICMLRDEPEHHTQLQDNIKKFQEIAKHLNIRCHESNTPIQFIKNLTIAEAVSVQEQLSKIGIGVQAIRPPTVQSTDIGIRIVLRSDHTHYDIEYLLEKTHANITSQ